MKTNRILKNDDVLKYTSMVEKYIRDSVVKNWNEAYSYKSNPDVSLGNSGYTIADIRQYLYAEVCVALRNYNPDFVTKEGRSVQESTFVYLHLYNRIGQLMKRLTKKSYGYGIKHINLEEYLGEIETDS